MLEEKVLGIIEKNSRVSTREMAVVLGTEEIDVINALQNIILDIQFAPLTVKVVVGDTYYQVVTQCLCPPQKVDMPLMQQIVCAVRNYLFHHSLYIAKTV